MIQRVLPKGLQKSAVKSPAKTPTAVKRVQKRRSQKTKDFHIVFSLNDYHHVAEKLMDTKSPHTTISSTVIREQVMGSQGNVQTTQQEDDLAEQMEYEQSRAEASLFYQDVVVERKRKASASLNEDIRGTKTRRTNQQSNSNESYMAPDLGVAQSSIDAEESYRGSVPELSMMDGSLPETNILSTCKVARVLNRQSSNNPSSIHSSVASTGE